MKIRFGGARLPVCAAVWLCLCVARTAGAQSSPPKSDAPTAGNAANLTDDAEIQRALQADQAAQAKNAAAAGAAGAAMPAPAATASQTETAAPAASGGRSFQTLNPDISVIVDLAAGYYSDNAGTIKSGDDPQSTGWKAQEIELALQQVVDPYFRADVYLTIPNLAGLEVEEAFLTSTALPGNLQVKAGVFRVALGRQNAQHLHVQDFTRRPAMNPQLIGVDGLHSPGLETNWLVPNLPFYLVVSGSAFSVSAADPDQPLQTFGGGGFNNFTYVGYARAFFPLSEATSVYAGLNYARGETSQSVLNPAAIPTVPPANTVYDGYGDNLYGADLYVKWKPPNQAETYASVAWQSEYFMRQIPNLVVDGVKHPQLEGGGYSQVVVQTHRRLYLGLRGELMGAPSGDNIKRAYSGSASVTWALSEFSRIRLYGQLLRGPPFLPLDPQPLESRTTGAAFLQLEAAIGAHGAHPF